VRKSEEDALKATPSLRWFLVDLLFERPSGRLWHLQIAGVARARSFLRHPTSLVHWNQDRTRMSVSAMTDERKPGCSHVLPRSHKPQADAAHGPAR